MSGSIERIAWIEERSALDEAIRRAQEPSEAAQAAAKKWEEEHPSGPRDGEASRAGRGMGTKEPLPQWWPTRADDGPLGGDA